jgi:hypothetical protein
MAAPARPDRHGTVIGIGLVVILAVGIGMLSLDDSTTPRARLGSDTPHGTRPPGLAADDVARASAAFGVDAPPERIHGGWEAEDPVRSLYLLRTPSAWYVTFEDASTLLQPAGDRAAICSGGDAPFACTIPGIELVADVAADPPDPTTAARVARRTLADAGLVTGRWVTLVLDPSTDVPPCREGLSTQFDCTRQVVPTRSVMLTRDFGAGTTAARFGVVVGPRGNVLSVTGRYAERRPG